MRKNRKRCPNRRSTFQEEKIEKVKREYLWLKSLKKSMEGLQTCNQEKCGIFSAR